ncbi:hypothetical protein [Methanoculleus chikugoensis]|uniref:hypothetical protein n=1 Tax=Methanoculleus chikugoensis TaxID=118126 RepID=UPI000A56AB14|nr:hypothetical protein [Methanoculleus chikugoensis]
MGDKRQITIDGRQTPCSLHRDRPLRHRKPLWGDVIYEGARSVSGPYLYILGAGALAVGVVAGAR